MKSQTWLIAVVAILATLYVLPVAVYAQETDTLRQTRDETPTESPQTTMETTRMTTAVPGPAVTGIKAFTIDLSGDAVAPGPGAAGEGSAFVVLNPNRGTVCYALDLAGISPATDAHIHEGAAGTAGPPVVNFGLGTTGLGGCVANVDASLIRRIGDDPSNFFVNVHNEDFPQGALRGQLMSAERQGS